jgi:hypothetical protein
MVDLIYKEFPFENYKNRMGYRQNFFKDIGPSSKNIVCDRRGTLPQLNNDTVFVVSYVTKWSSVFTALRYTLSLTTNVTGFQPKNYGNDT